LISTSKRYVDKVVAELLAPLLAKRPTSEWELVGWDAEQGICITLRKGDTCLLIELEDFDDSRDCYARTEVFNVCVRRQFEYGRDLETEDRQVVDSVVNMVREREEDLPVFERPVTTRRRAVRKIEVNRVLIAEGRGHYYINPYVGCMIGCEFCYVAQRADMSRRLEGLPHLPWGRDVDVKVNAPDVLRREVKSNPSGLVRLSPILTDPYQAIERKDRVTRGCLEVLAEAGFDVAVLTRSANIVEDLELLRSFKRAMVGFSIPSDQDRYRGIFEPGAEPIEDRIRALEACRAAGLFTVAFVQPMLPMNTDHLVDVLAPLVDAVRIDRMYAMGQAGHLYRENGLEQAATDSFFEKTRIELTAGFEARGVLIDDLDDIVAVFEKAG